MTRNEWHSKHPQMEGHTVPFGFTASAFTPVVKDTSAVPFKASTNTHTHSHWCSTGRPCPFLRYSGFEAPRILVARLL